MWNKGGLHGAFRFLMKNIIKLLICMAKMCVPEKKVCVPDVCVYMCRCDVCYVTFVRVMFVCQSVCHGICVEGTGFSVYDSLLQPLFGSGEFGCQACAASIFAYLLVSPISEF